MRSVLHRLVADGLVDVEDHGSAYAYRCNRDHVLYEAIVTTTLTCARNGPRPASSSPGPALDLLVATLDGGGTVIAIGVYTHGACWRHPATLLNGVPVGVVGGWIDGTEEEHRTR